MIMPNFRVLMSKAFCVTFYAVNVVSFKMVLWRQNICDSIWRKLQ